MTQAWLVLVLVGAATVALKSAGPVLLGGRQLPPRVMAVVELLAPAVLSALVVSQALGAPHRLVLDARLAGVAVAAVALWRRAAMLLVLVLAAGATALWRAVG